jgi:hypothetical protein
MFHPANKDVLKYLSENKLRENVRMAETQLKITATELKCIAIAAMVVDHVAWKITLPVPTLFAMHIIGRMTMPIMCFLVAEGFWHTSNRKRYVLRLLVFGLIAQLPFNYYWSGNPFAMSLGLETFNVLFDLMLGLCVLWAVKSGLRTAAKIATVALCLVLSTMCDWFVFGVLWILVFGLNHDSYKHKAIWFSVIASMVVVITVALDGNAFMFMNLGTFLVLPLLFLYNGERFGVRTPAWLANKWLFYAFYPIHLLLLGVLYYG